MLFGSLKNNLVFIFATRLLKPKNRIFPNLGVIMSGFAVAISVAVLIIVISVMNGFTAELIQKILGLNPHITLYSREKSIANVSDSLNSIKSIQGVKYVFPTINGTGMVIGNGNESAGVFIKGIDKKDIQQNKELAKTIIGDLENFNGYKIILGKEIARQLGVRPNTKVNLIVPVVANTIAGSIPRQVKLSVAGVINSNSQQYDNYMAILPFKTAQRIFNMKNNASAIEIITDAPDNLTEIEDKLFKLFNGKFFITDWKMENNALLHALQVEANVMGLILGLFVVISIFTIFAVIRMMIKSKEREIAILKANGVSNEQICGIFIAIGLSLSLIGMLFGNVIGISFAKNVDNIRLFLEQLFHTKLFDGSVYLLSNLPSRLMLADVVKINLFCFICSVICVLFSVKKNTKIDVVKVLKNN